MSLPPPKSISWPTPVMTGQEINFLNHSFAESLVGNDDDKTAEHASSKSKSVSWPSPVMTGQQISFNSTYIIFCGPVQSSTLLSEAFLSALSLKKPTVHDACPPEFFNPACSKTPEIMEQCFGSQGEYSHQIWNPCKTKNESFENILVALKQDGAGLVKENVGTWQLLEFHRKGYPVFVAHRLPQHTFPIKHPVVRRFWTAIWDSFLAADPQTSLLQLPAGERLVQLQQYANNVSSHLVGFQPECLAHYIHFWHLLTIAIENDIPHVQIEKVLLAHDQTDIITELTDAGICRQDRINEKYCKILAEKLDTIRNNVIHPHDSNYLKKSVVYNSTQSLSANLYHSKEKSFEEEGTCRDALVKIIDFCSSNVPGCDEVNKAYNIDYFQ